MRLRTAGPLLLLLLLPAGGPTLAQERAFPYALSRRDLLILPVAFGLSELGGHLAEQPDPVTIAEIEALRPSEVNPFDRCATRYWSFDWEDRSDGYRDAVILSAGLLLSTQAVVRGRLSESVTVAVMLAETYFLLRGVTLTTKGLVGRYRPYLYNTDRSAQERSWRDEEEAALSFFSGHAAAAFAVATFTSKVFTDVHGRSAGTDLLWGSSLSLAALTGYARIRAGMHYPSDVVVGALVGGAIGWLVPTFHRSGRTGGITLVVAPRGFRVHVPLGDR
jgi:membrane-associated phospholipid phosphatase